MPLDSSLPSCWHLDTSPQEHSPTPAAGTARLTLTDRADWDSGSQPPCGWGKLLQPPNSQAPAVLPFETHCDTRKTGQDSPGPAVADLLSFHPWRHPLIPGPQATSPTHGLFPTSFASLVLTHSPTLGPPAGTTTDSQSPVTRGPSPATGTQQLVPWTHTGTNSGCWHSSPPYTHARAHGTDALQPGKELETEFDKRGQTALVRSGARPDERVTYLHTSSPFYPLIPLSPCRKSRAIPKRSSPAPRNASHAPGSVSPPSRRGSAFDSP